MRKRALIALSMALLLVADSAKAGSVGDFFKALGNSIAHPGQQPKPKPREPQSKRPKTKGTALNPDYPPAPIEIPVPTATATATLPQIQVRVASVPSQTKSSKRDIPYAIPVPNKPGFVTSPYAPKQGLVDVRGFPSGTEVLDPYSGKVFLTP
jgi:hypothetical protein